MRFPRSSDLDAKFSDVYSNFWMVSLIDLRIWLEWTIEPSVLAGRGSGGSLGLQDICRIV